MNRVKIAIGADIGGTHITAALVDLQNKTIIPSSIQRATVNAAGTANEIIAAWSACLAAAKKNTEAENICVAMPGPFDYENGISLMRGQDKYEALYGLNIKEQLADSLNLSKEEFFMVNDAACFLQGEIFNGIASNYEKSNVIGITLGTGLGSAVYKKGKSRSADMWCWPFGEGIAEDYLSTRWFVQRWHELTGEIISGVKDLASKRATDTNVLTIFTEFADNLTNFLSDFIAKEQPAAIVIGGNIAKTFDRFGLALTTNINSRHTEVKIEQAKLGEQAQLLGAVSSWLRYQQTGLTLS